MYWFPASEYFTLIWGSLPVWICTQRDTSIPYSLALYTRSCDSDLPVRCSVMVAPAPVSWWAFPMGSLDCVFGRPASFSFCMIPQPSFTFIGYQYTSNRLLFLWRWAESVPCVHNWKLLMVTWNSSDTQNVWVSPCMCFTWSTPPHSADLGLKSLLVWSPSQPFSPRPGRYPCRMSL